MEPALSGNRVAPPSVGGTDTVEPVYRGMYRYPVFQMMPLHDVHDLPDALKTGTPGECVLQYGPFLIRYRTEEA
jgi:hypothetical protein